MAEVFAAGEYRVFSDTIDTTDYPPGRYIYLITYESVEDEVIDAVPIEFELREPTNSNVAEPPD